MAQGLEAPCRIGVVIGMTLQLIQEKIGDDMIAVPGMPGLATFVTPVGFFLAPQAVMFHVVDDFQQGSTIKSLQQQKGQNDPAQPQRQQAEKPHSHQPALQVFIVQGPARLVTALQALRLNLPGGSHAADHGAW